MPGALPSRVGGRVAGAIARACSCFEAGTEVWTEERIEDIQVGDRLLSRDDATGETAYRPVVELIRNQDRPIWEVTVELSDGSTEVIATTDEHPWRTTDGHWVEADDLALGLELVRAEGEPAEVISVIATDRTADTYNFEVEGFHTYFVGEAGVWVHNACRTGLLRQLALHRQKLEDYMLNPLAHDNPGHLRNAPSAAIADVFIKAESANYLARSAIMSGNLGYEQYERKFWH